MIYFNESILNNCPKSDLLFDYWIEFINKSFKNRKIISEFSSEMKIDASNLYLMNIDIASFEKKGENKAIIRKFIPWVNNNYWEIKKDS